MRTSKAESFLTSGRPFEMIRGDALQVLRRLPDESIDAVVTDPPYGIELKLGTTRNARSIAGDGRVEARRLWKAFVPEAYRVARPDTAHVFFGTWKSPWMFAVLSRHFSVRGCVAWNKRVIGLGYYLRPQWEMAYFCVKGRPPRAAKAPPDVWECTRVMRPRHPCEKPVPLLRRAVQLVASPGSIVLDPFAGICATGVAALLEGCRFLGSEIDPRHHQLALARLRATAAGPEPT